MSFFYQVCCLLQTNKELKHLITKNKVPGASSELFSNKKKKVYICLAFIGLITIFVSSISIGAFFIPLKEVFITVFSGFFPNWETSSVYKTVVWDIRMTRILLAVAVGGSLASSGAVFQGVFRNPLIDPYILGVSSGAAFGAAIAILFNFPFSVQISAFLFGALAVFITSSLARINGQTPLITLILSGVIVGSFFFALVAMFQYLGSVEQMQRLVFWIMGGLYNASWSNIRTIYPVFFIGFLILWYNSWNINVLSMGEEEAKSLGVQTNVVKFVLVISATAITAIAVSASGIIGWVGLMIPHAARLIIGPDHRFLIPLSALLGAAFLIICDTLARVLITGEIPIGIITSILGAPYFIFLLRRRINYFGG